MILMSPRAYGMPLFVVTMWKRDATDTEDYALMMMMMMMMMIVVVVEKHYQARNTRTRYAIISAISAQPAGSAVFLHILYLATLSSTLI